MATNRIDILDSALLRPGRIDRKVEFPHPSIDVKFLFITMNYYLFLKHLFNIYIQLIC